MAEAASGGGASTSAAPVLDTTTGAGRRQPLKTRQFAALQGRVVGTFAARMSVAASGAAVDLLEAEDWWDPARPGRVLDGKHGFKARLGKPPGRIAHLASAHMPLAGPPLSQPRQRRALPPPPPDAPAPSLPSHGTGPPDH